MRPRDREKTLEHLRNAIELVKRSGRRLSIAAVANEAGVTPGLIHNTYPDVAEEIREQTGRSSRQRLYATVSELALSRDRSRQLDVDLCQAKADIAKLASINETLRNEVATLRAVADGKVVPMPPRKESP